MLAASGFSTVAILANLLTAAAQMTDAACLASYAWASNSRHQSPCLVAAYALGACIGGSYNVEALNPSTHYVGPSLPNANACQCSTVAYSLMSACGDCQNLTYVTWSVWSSNCLTPYLSVFPTDIPPATSIPAWAYLDVKTNDTYSPELAKLDVNATESTAAGKPTAVSATNGTSSATVSTTGTSSLTPPTPVSASSSIPTMSAEANVIGGSVSGGLLGLAVLTSLISCIVIRRRRKVNSLGNALTTY